MRFYEYRVYWWNDFSSDEEVSLGLTCASSFEEAMHNIGSYYGKEAIIHVEITYTSFDEYSCLDFEDHKEEIDKYNIIKAINVVTNKPI